METPRPTGVPPTCIITPFLADAHPRLYNEDTTDSTGRLVEDDRSTCSGDSSQNRFYPALEQPLSHGLSSLADTTCGSPENVTHGQGHFPLVNASPVKAVEELRQRPTSSRSNSLQSDLPSLPSQSFRQESPRALRTKIKRAPASWSSNGIETSSGPPPALITQRTYVTGHVVWPINNPALDSEGQVNLGGSVPQSRQSDSMRNINHRSSPSPSKPGRPLSWGNATINKTNDRRSREHPPDEEEDRDRTLRALEGRDVDSPNGKEDVFLNLARVNLTQESGEGPSLRNERRRSRIGLNGKRQSLPSEPPSTSLLRMSLQGQNGNAIDGIDSSPASGAEDQRYQTRSRRTSHPANNLLVNPSFHTKASATASAHPMDDTSRTRYFETAARGSPAPRSTLGIDNSSRSGHKLRSAGRSQAYLQGNHIYNSTPNSYDSSPSVIRNGGTLQQTNKADGTNSTTSTNDASSTVWDELDDLKSRIRKLESNGKLHASSSGGPIPERPRTATTTMTTMSSSPKRKAGEMISAVNPTIEEITTAGVHPLLHAALAKSKPLLGSETYRALEGTAMDALTLAAAMTSGIDYSPRNNDHLSSGASVIMPNGIVSERQIRRKADSICRGLTELCLALTDAASSEAEKSPSNTGRSSNMDSSSHHPHHRRQISGGGKELRFQEPTESREGSVEPGESHPPPSTVGGGGTRTTSRALTRAEARRTSLLALNANNKSSRSGREVARSAAGKVPSLNSSPQMFLPKQRSSNNILLDTSNHNNEDANNGRGKQRPISIQLRAPSRADTEAGIGSTHSSGGKHLRRSSIGLRNQIQNQNNLTVDSTQQQSSNLSTTTTSGGGRRYLERSSLTTGILQQHRARDREVSGGMEENTITLSNVNLNRRRERARSLGSVSGSGSGTAAGFVAGGGGEREAGIIGGRGEVRFER